MISHLSTSLLAGCALQLQVAAEVPTTAVSSPLKAQDLLSRTTHNNKHRRLLQKFKKRKQRAHNPENQPASLSGRSDVGILSNSDTPRFLEEAADYDYYCPRDTCPTELCDCADSGGSLEDCTEELQHVCSTGKLGDCVFSEYLQVYQEVYCPFVSCVGEGFHENQCDCAFYELYCGRLEGAECTSFVKAEGPDKKPFFGCDETELAGICDEAKSCKAKGDLQGLPLLGTWQGTVTTGIKSKSSGEKMGAGAVAAVAVFSVIWQLM